MTPKWKKKTKKVLDVSYRLTKKPSKLLSQLCHYTSRQQLKGKVILEVSLAGTTPTDTRRAIGPMQDTILDVKARRTAGTDALRCHGPEKMLELVALCFWHWHCCGKGWSGKDLEPVRKTPRNRSFFLEELHSAIDEHLPLQSLAALMTIPKNSMGKDIHEDLCYKSYVLKILQYLTDTTKTKRVEWWELRLGSLKHLAARRKLFFLDEKILTDGAERRQASLPVILEEFPASSFQQHATTAHIWPQLAIFRCSGPRGFCLPDLSSLHRHEWHM